MASGTAAVGDGVEGGVGDDVGRSRRFDVEVVSCFSAWWSRVGGVVQQLAVGKRSKSRRGVMHVGFLA
jgi:hypothetical protein